MNEEQLSETPVSYQKTLHISASSEIVYEALTTNDGIAGWWSGKVQGVHAEGSTFRLEFDGPGHVIEMRVDELRDGKQVVWTCLAHNVFTEWPSTKVNFALSTESDGSCKLSFEHVGLKPACDCYGDCSRGWDHFLSSLKSYCETGVGAPWK
jgi:uncharacterized protein YndB with AHSA1/START domain